MHYSPSKKIFRIAIAAQLIAFGWSSVMAQSFPITADQSIKGAQPVVGVSQGVPVIQIAPPKAGGVSHNRFTHFNVGPAGAVLNNSGGSSQTQMAGHIAGNPMLGNKHAGIILNQVTAANPSTLQGMLEVAGHRAHVILANPAGITCNGCGFLNTSRATLTTGRPDVGPSGGIAFDVASGILAIDGQGLDGTQTGQVDLFGRALVLNAGVWADRINVVTGPARIDALSGHAEPAQGQGPIPAFSLDTAAVGGMYANSIKLIGTESGVGVHVGGNLVALTGDLTLTSAGDVRITPKGSLSAKQTLAVTASGDLDTQQSTLHGNEVNIAAQTLHNQKGSITSANAITIRLQKALRNTEGLIAATGNHVIQASQLDNVGGTVAGRTLSVDTQQGIDNRKGLIFADDAMTLTAAQLVNKGTLGGSQSSTVAAPSDVSAAKHSPVRLSTGVAAKTLTLRIPDIDNEKGSIQANVDLSLTSNNLNNTSGLIATQHHTDINVGKLINRDGTLSAAEQLTATVSQLDGLGWLQSGADLSFTYPGALTPHGNFIAGRDLKLQLSGAFVNKARLSAGRDLLIHAHSLENTSTGELLGGRHTTVTVPDVVRNTGLIDGQYTRINAWQIHNGGRIYGDSISLAGSYLNNDAGPSGSALIASRGDLNLGVRAVNNVNHSVLYAKANLKAAGTLDSAGVPAGKADQLRNVGASIEAGSSLRISAHDIQNHNAGFAAENVHLWSQHKVFVTPEGSTAMYDMATNWFCDLVTSGCSRDPHWLNDDPERRFLLPSAHYPESRYGPIFNYAPRRVAGVWASSPIALAYTVTRDEYAPEKENFHYSRDSPIWAAFGVSPPSQEPSGYRGLKEYRARSAELDKHIKAFNKDFRHRLVENFTFYEVNDVATTSRTVRSDPARIISAGTITLNGVVTNDKSQIAASGRLDVQGPAINNIGATGRNLVVREGQSTFTQARRHDRKAHRAHYHTVLSEQPFDLPVGPLRSVVAPQVSVPVRFDTNQEYGTLMAGRQTYINSQGNFINSGTVGAAETMEVKALNIVNHSGGQIQASRIYLDARENLSNIAARIQGNTVSLRAGQNVNLISTEGSSDVGSTRGTHMSGTSQVSANELTIQAENDILMLAAEVAVERNARLKSGRDIRLDAATLKHHELISSGVHQRHEVNTQKVIGSTATSKQDLAFYAGKDFAAQAAELHAENQLTVWSDQDVIIDSGVDSGSATDQYREKRKGMFSSTTETTAVSGEWQQSHPSTLTGKNVEIIAGGNVYISGSDVGAEQDLAITAIGSVDIAPGHSQSHSTRVDQIKKSGVGATGGMSVGSSKQTHSVEEQRTGNTPSTLGSLNGDTHIIATQTVKMVGSKIAAPNGNVEIHGSSVSIGAAEDTMLRIESFESKQSGISVSIDTPLIDAAKSTANQLNSASKTESSLIKALAAANAGFQTAETLATIKQRGEMDDATAVDKAGGVRVNVQVGSSQQSSKTVSQTSSTVGSSVFAGKNIRIDAEGAQDNSHIDIVASTLSARNAIAMTADGHINLQNGLDTSKTERDSKGYSAAIGVGASVGSSSAAVGFTGSASVQKGNSAGTENAVVGTKISAGQKVTLTSGGDMNIHGSVVSSETIVANVGADLTIKSVQDTSSFKSKDISAGVSVTMGAGSSASGNVAKTKVSGDFASVRDQSGFQAGDGGFNIDVKGHTNLKGAAISSTEEAVRLGRNYVKTDTLTVSDIENHSDYKTTGLALSASYAGGEGGLGPGRSESSGKESSTTRSGISGAAIQIVDHETQRKLTGETADQLLALLDADIRTGDSAGGLAKGWDPEKLRSKIAAEAEIISTFTLQVGQTIKSYANEKRNALREQMKTSESEEKEALQQQINTLNMEERVMNVIVGALTGSVDISVVHAGLSQAADEMRQYMIADSKKFPGITDGESTLDNYSGESAGIRGDGFKGAGVRVVLDAVCGKMNENCITKKNGNDRVLDALGVPVLELDKNGKVQFDPKAARQTLAQWLAGPSGKNFAGFTGGIQGGPGTLGGKPYEVGSALDLMHEAYAGPHDFIGGTLTGFYDKQGNARQGLTNTEERVYGVLSGVALVPATPFALSEALPASVWQALDIFLGSLK